MFVDAAGLSHVEHRHDLPVRVDFDSGRHGVRAGSVDEVRKWHDPVVVDSIRIEANGPGEIALLDPELRCSRELGNEKANDLVPTERRPRWVNAKVLRGHVPSESTSVVAEAVRDDHLVSVELELLGPSGSLRMNAEPACQPLDAVDRGVEHVRAGTAADVLVVRL